MPPKELKPCKFEFTHNGKRYRFDNFCIYDYYTDVCVCYCDLTATNYYGNEEVMLICCKIALDAYDEGYVEGKCDAKREIRKTLGL